MFKLCIFAALLVFAVADPKPKPGIHAVAPLVAEAPIAYTAGYAAPLAYPSYGAHYSAPVVSAAAYSAPLAYAHGGHLAYTAPVATYFK